MTTAERRFRRSAIRYFTGIKRNRNGFLLDQADQNWIAYIREKTEVVN